VTVDGVVGGFLVMAGFVDCELADNLPLNRGPSRVAPRRCWGRCCRSWRRRKMRCRPE
jgi:hypothetical protein